MFKKQVYPENMTYKESFLCVGCIYQNDPIFCQRWQTHKYGCAVKDLRLSNDENSN